MDVTNNIDVIDILTLNFRIANINDNENVGTIIMVYFIDNNDKSTCVLSLMQ